MKKKLAAWVAICQALTPGGNVGWLCSHGCCLTNGERAGRERELERDHHRRAERGECRQQPPDRDEAPANPDVDARQAQARVDA
jgi:hypothetical protein